MIPLEILKKIQQIELRTNRIVCRLLCLGPLLFLCSCATASRQATIVPAMELPADVLINKEAGAGGHLMVTLRLETGEQLPFMVDTGSPVTLLDTSLESQLGKRSGTIRVGNASGDKQTSRVFSASKLYLGNTRLMTGDRVLSYDFNQHPMGLLGMDCLSHYCIQLDFEAGKMCFLNSTQLNTAGLGKAFPLMFKDGYPFIHSSNLVGESADLLVDVGCTIDGFLDRGTNKFEGAYLPECHWSGESYSNLIVVAPRNVNAIGLRFLARHLVTMDFPNQTLYLKRISAGPSDNIGFVDVGESAWKSGLKFLMRKIEKGQLPGWSTAGKEPVYFEEHSTTNSKSVSFTFREKNGSTARHYAIARTEEGTPWQMQKAWQTDRDGNTTEDYLVP